MGLETGTYINSLNSSWPIGATDPKSEGDDHFRLIKSTIKNTLPNLSGAMTATHTELNLLDGATASTVELNYVTGVTSSIQTQIDAKLVIASNLSDLANAATSRSNLGVDAAGTDNSTDVTLAGTPNYITIVGQAITRALINLTSHITGTLPLGNGGTNSTTAASARTSLGVDPIGTDNSTDVTLAGTPDYITISGQAITRNQIDLAADVTGALPYANMALTGEVLNADLDGGIVDAKLSTPGALKLIETQTASSSAQLDFTTGISSTYDTYIFKISRLIIATNTQNIRLQFSTDGGSSFVTGICQQAGREINTAGTETFVSGTAINYVNLILSATNATTTGVSGSIEIHDPSDATRHKSLEYNMSGYESTANRWKSSVGMGAIGTTTAINAFRIITSSGNINSGEISLYGVVK